MIGSDPYGEVDVEPVGRKKMDTRGEAVDFETPGESDDLNRVLAFQPRNDFGNANRLITRFGNDLLYVENVGWFAWDGTRWDREGGRAAAMRLCHRVAQLIRDEAKALKEKPGRISAETIDKLFGWAILSGNQAKAHAMLDAAHDYLVQKLEVLDADPLSVACDNGTILLRKTIQTRPSERKDYITRRLGVPYIEGGGCPRFHAFLERVMPDADMREFLQRIAGYCLTGSTREQCVFIFYGVGRNGKSTFVNVLRHIMGDYAMNSPISTFLAKREGSSGSEASPDVARLPGVRLLTASEPPESARLDEGAIKAMTSNEVVTARHLNQGFFEFRPKFKLMISTNHFPTIRGTDLGIWRRIRLVPWTISIPEDEVDPELEAKLIAEAPGILQWMLDGAEEWLSVGLAPPEKARAAVEDYKAAQDPVGEFLAECCDLTGDLKNPSTDRPYETSAEKLRKAYVAWCTREGLDPIKGNAFGAKLAGKGVQKRKSNGLTVYVGVYLRSEFAGL